MSAAFDAGQWVDAAIKAGMDPQAIVVRGEGRYLSTREDGGDYENEPPRPSNAAGETRAVIDELIRRGRVSYAETLVGGAPSA